ncbi:hypothetical protein [Umezawaea sp. NPDC059074]|uniref:hypothetical protein n=1 Tax=Umezawaea sp. NPDC059074 TaxID=3346716 RepID=UPI0036C27CAF
MTDDKDVRSAWRHHTRREVGRALVDHADTGPVPEAWFEPFVRAMVHEPDPSFSRQLVQPTIIAFGRRRVRRALIALLDTDVPADIAGAARAWYWTQARLSYEWRHLRNPEPENVTELDDLRQQYHHTALRRFVTVDDLHVRQCILPGLPLNPELYPDDLHHLVTQAVRIARTSSDDYLRDRVEIQILS